MGLPAFTKSRFILCEGDDDKGFLEALISRLNLPGFQVCHAHECGGVGGKTGFSKALRGMEVLTGFGNLIGILVVADNDEVGTTFAEVQKAITDSGNTPPASYDAIGNLKGKPLAVRMVPSHDVAGDFESLCLPAIHAHWSNANRCVTDFLQCTGANNWTTHGSLNKARARAASVGFYEPDPFKGIGHLFRNGELPVNDHCFDAVAAFLRNFDAMCGL